MRLLLGPCQQHRPQLDDQDLDSYAALDRAASCPAQQEHDHRRRMAVLHVAVLLGCNRPWLLLHGGTQIFLKALMMLLLVPRFLMYRSQF